ncbi:MAG: M3 family metallopeptidase [Paracoccus sp. (in: a-proteobacteria)]|uniref:M3 family metallopeptidase n=1 Tax=Paracoccus sp. TaxID=267 RepID=UPI0026DFD353|nr:M3 family metallopeptidase [Paracoccus sp. (in: a-proteobacteria)]MDO5621414.1 M3 family metallopeptidase [Paracoccus sp. (in: a-proteobacteria)]
MNRELTHWSGPQGLPRFDLISDADFAPAFTAALAESEAAWEAIATNPEPASFANTIAAMETADEALDRVAAVFFTLSAVDSNPAREALQRDLAPKLAAHGAKIGSDPRLFVRVQAVLDQGGLTGQDLRIAELALRGLRRSGAGLDAVGRDRLSAIMQRLAALYTAFSQNVLRDERDFLMPIPDDGLAGLSPALVADMQAAARDRGLPGQVLTLNRSLIVPFLEQSTRRDLRRAGQEAWAARGSGAGAGGAETDNRPLIAEILALRHERARMLGYADFAAFKLETEMAGSAERVQDLLEQVWTPARARVAADQAALEDLARDDGVNDGVQAWDWRHYAARRRAAAHQLDEAGLRPYFSLDAMLGAVFDVAHRLFGLSVEPFEAPLWYPDVRAWRVLRDGQQIAVFLGDYFARSGKRSGAWCSALQSQHGMGAGQQPIVVNVCNFTPPAEAGAAALLGWDDVRTLFHEFGHALHQMLSDVTYPSISGTSVARDFVELPSQLLEHWAEQPEVLDAHARHTETGATLSADLRDKMLAAGKADAGFATLEYLQSALVDLALHRGAPAADAMAATDAVLTALDAPAAVPMRHATPHFAHAFSSDGYSAGYYSYMWSEVMDADAFAAFEESGDIFDPATSERLRATILSQGGAAPADELWLRFRGAMPGVGPLLKGRGLA